MPICAPAPPPAPPHHHHHLFCQLRIFQYRRLFQDGLQMPTSRWDCPGNDPLPSDCPVLGTYNSRSHGRPLGWRPPNGYGMGQNWEQSLFQKRQPACFMGLGVINVSIHAYQHTIYIRIYIIIYIHVDRLDQIRLDQTRLDQIRWIDRQIDRQIRLDR